MSIFSIAELRSESFPSKFGALESLLVQFIRVFGADDTDAMEHMIPRYYNKYVSNYCEEVAFFGTLQGQHVRDVLGASQAAFFRRARVILRAL